MNEWGYERRVLGVRGSERMGCKSDSAAPPFLEFWIFGLLEISDLEVRRTAAGRSACSSITCLKEESGVGDTRVNVNRGGVERGGDT